MATSHSDLGRIVSPLRVVEVVTKMSGLTLDMLAGPARTRTVANWRHITQMLLRTFSWQSLDEIGQFLGGRHHTTVMYGVNRGIEMASQAPWDTVVLEAKKALAGEEEMTDGE